MSQEYLMILKKNNCALFLEAKKMTCMSFLKKIAAKALIMCHFFIFLSPVPAFAAKAILKDIEVTNTDESHLLLYFKVAGCFTEDMEKAIGSGINTTFNFFVRVYEVRDLWWDKKLADVQIHHDVQYDSLKKLYKVKLSERGDATIFVPDFEEVKKLMSEIIGLKVAELKDLQTAGHYQVRMMAELDKIRFPLNLHNVFFFVSLWDFKTDWYSVDFTY